MRIRIRDLFDPGFGIFLTLDSGSGIEKIRIQDKHPGSTTLLYSRVRDFRENFRFNPSIKWTCTGTVPGCPVWDAECDLFVEATGSPQRRVQRIRPVRRTDYNNLTKNPSL